jgi:hypothetical protein
VHFTGLEKKGPTKEHPDPLKPNLSQREVAKAVQPKRKAPFPRSSTKRFKAEVENVEGDQSMENDSSRSNQDNVSFNSTYFDVESVDDNPELHENKKTQTDFTKQYF